MYTCIHVYMYIYIYIYIYTSFFAAQIYIHAKSKTNLASPNDGGTDIWIKFYVRFIN